MAIYSRLDRIMLAIILPLCLYLMTAMGTFQWRHPWMTGTEKLAYIGRALTFGTVTKEEVRAWEDEP